MDSGPEEKTSLILFSLSRFRVEAELVKGEPLLFSARWSSPTMHHENSKGSRPAAPFFDIPRIEVLTDKHSERDRPVPRRGGEVVSIVVLVLLLGRQGRRVGGHRPMRTPSPGGRQAHKIGRGKQQTILLFDCRMRIGQRNRGSFRRKAGATVEARAAWWRRA